MDYIIRDKSIITGKNNLESLYVYKNFPVFFGCVDTDTSEDVRADMSFAICPESGVIQLDKLLPLEVLYQAQHMDGTGPTWKAFYEDFVQYIKQQAPRNVLEIGGGSGALGEVFIQNTENTHWTIVEPNPLHPGNDRIKIIKAFFDAQFQYEDDSFDAVVFSHTLEHAYDPNAFLEAIAKYLDVGQKLIFAYPQLDTWLGNKFTTALNFEHNMLLTPYFVDYLLKKFGFTIIDRHAYKEHSVYYTVEKVAQAETNPQFENKYDEYKSLFMDFIQYHKDIVENFNQQISRYEGEVYLFGAHIFSQYLIEFGLDTSKITGILDNSPLKQGKRLYGSSLRVYSPEHLQDKPTAAVILKVGPYRDEVYNQLMDINPDTVVLE